MQQAFPFSATVTPTSFKAYKFVISGIRANNAAATQSYLIKIK